MFINAYLITTYPLHIKTKNFCQHFFSLTAWWMKAGAMTTKMVVPSIIAIIKQCLYHSHTGYRIIVFNFIAKEKQL